MATKKTVAETVEIRPIEIKKVKLKIVGDTPLVMHAWSEKAKRMMLDAQMKKAKGKVKEARSPVEDFINSMYWLTEPPRYAEGATEEEKQRAFYEAIDRGAKFGFPVTAFKQAAISAAYRSGWVKDKMGLRGAFFIEGDENGFVEIKSDTPIMREDMVKLAMGVADIRYRGEFRNWTAKLIINYNTQGQYSFENLINIISAGGYLCGVGEWRPERDGSYGQFHVEGAEG